MHSILVHGYHLAILPFWRAPVAAFAAALICRKLNRNFVFAAAPLALLAGWLAAQYPVLTIMPAKPIYRLAGLAIILLAFAWLAPRAPKRAGFLTLPCLALAASWWIAGAKLNGPGIADGVPIFLGVLGVLALTRRLASLDRGWAGMGAALALSAAILLAGGAPHWALAALVPACAGVALAGVAEAVLPLAFATILVGCLAVVASNRGRFFPVDVAMLAPLLVWFLTPRILPRLKQVAPALATLASAGLTLGAIRLLAMR